MYVRYKIDGTRRLLHFSTVQYTTAPGAGEADAILSGVNALPADLLACRLTANMASVEIDPTYIPPAQDYSGFFDSNKWLKALGIACSNQTIVGIAWSTGGYTPAQIKARTIAVYQTL